MPLEAADILDLEDEASDMPPLLLSSTLPHVKNQHSSPACWSKPPLLKINTHIPSIKRAKVPWAEMLKLSRIFCSYCHDHALPRTG